MRIRKHTKISSLYLSHASIPPFASENLHTHVCELNRSPCDAAPQSDLSCTDEDRAEIDDNISRNSVRGESVNDMESVASLNEQWEKEGHSQCHHHHTQLRSYNCNCQSNRKSDGPQLLAVYRRRNRVMDPTSSDRNHDHLEEEVPQHIIETTKKRTRGVTKLPGIIKSGSSVKQVVEFNNRGQPIGDVSIKFSSYLGSVGRKMVPISIESWHKVDDDTKEKMWQMVQNIFVVPLERKKKVLQDIGQKWRDFKGRMSRKYVKKFKKTPELLRHPPEKYKWIEQAHWDLFVKSRLSEEFELLSALQSEKQVKNIYPHRMARRGYARLEIDMLKDIGTSSNKIDRCLLWKKARQDKSGEYKNDVTREKALKMDELKKLTQEGSLSIQGSNDILTMALETPEHPGRVRGVGSFVTPTTYFHLPRQPPKKVVAEIETLKSQVHVQGQVIQELEAKINALMQQGPQMEIPRSDMIGSNSSASEDQPNSNGNSRGSIDIMPLSPQKAKGKTKYDITLMETLRSEKNGSNNSANKDQSKSRRPNDLTPLFPKKAKEKTKDGRPPSDSNGRDLHSFQCKLALRSRDNIVAYGRAFCRIPNETIHCAPLAEGLLRVSIGVVKDYDALLPMPTKEYSTVGGAIGSVVTWPCEHVLLDTEEGQTQDKTNKTEIIQEFTQYVHSRLSHLKHVFIPIMSSIFGEVIDLNLDIHDILYVCKMQEVSVNCIMIYCSHLNEVIVDGDLVGKYGFVNPTAIHVNNKNYPNAQKFADILVTLISGTSFYFFPLNIGFHWILLVIDFSNNKLYWFDPLNGSISPNVKSIVKEAFSKLKDYVVQRGQPEWITVKCPRQPDTKSCGLYVMRYMRDLIEDRSGLPIDKRVAISSKRIYTRDELDNVRLEWINVIKPYLRNI